jgi:membrane-associated phospholipid phosphatase
MQMASIILISLGSWLMSLNDQLLIAINALAGRSWLFDSVVALFLDNDLAKAGVIGCCFLAAWYSGKGVAASNRRKILLTTIIAAVCVIAITKTLSKTVFLPRPAIQSQRLYQLEGDQLTEMKRMPVRTPLDEESQKEHQALVSGNLETNDLGSFPSDHAGFFLVISFGIWLASRRLGWVALGWTGFVILAGKMISAQHTPLDIAAGAFVALSVLAILRFLAARRLVDRLLAWISQLTIRHGALSSAFIFAIVFEMSSTLVHVRQFAGLLGAVRRHVLGLG